MRDDRIERRCAALLTVAQGVLDPDGHRYPLAYVWLDSPPVFGAAQMVAWAEGPTSDRPAVDPKCRPSHTVVYRLQLVRPCVPLASIEGDKPSMPDPVALHQFARDFRRDIDTLMDHLSFAIAWAVDEGTHAPEVPRWDVESIEVSGIVAVATLATRQPWAAKRDCYTADGTDCLC